MQRRSFLMSSLAGVVSAGGSLLFPHRTRGQEERRLRRGGRADVVIVGGGLGGCAAALAALRAGLRVVLTDPTDWLGGQLTQQAVPPDEHRWIETHGATASYRQLRSAIRRYYREHYPLTSSQRDNEFLNPGGGSVSRLCHEPRVAVAVLESLLAAYRSAGRLSVLLEHEPLAASVRNHRVESVTLRNLIDGHSVTLEAPWFVDATELGDLLPLTGTAFVTGAESREETGELHAAERADPANQQAFTICFAVDYDPARESVIERPAAYDFWRDFVPELHPPWPGRLLDWTYSHPATLQPRQLGFHPAGPVPASQLNLWIYRRIAARSHHVPGTFDSDICLVNWPQNDYLLGNLVGVTDEQRREHIARAKQLSLSLLYWMQTEAPRDDGGRGWPGLRLRPDVVGTQDGLAKYPYVRESRRIRAELTVLESHCGRENRAQVTGQALDAVTAKHYPDSVGVGYYHIDLHPSTAGDNYIDFPSLPFQIPLGSLLPRETRNLLPACKNIGTTHVTNGCYRLHPVEWNLGESVGTLLAYCHERQRDPHDVRARAAWLGELQQLLEQSGVELAWPAG
jgi:hypothetical protein